MRVYLRINALSCQMIAGPFLENLSRICVAPGIQVAVGYKVEFLHLSGDQLAKINIIDEVECGFIESLMPLEGRETSREVLDLLWR